MTKGEATAETGHTGMTIDAVATAETGQTGAQTGNLVKTQAETGSTAVQAETGSTIEETGKTAATSNTIEGTGKTAATEDHHQVTRPK